MSDHVDQELARVVAALSEAAPHKPDLAFESQPKRPPPLKRRFVAKMSDRTGETPTRRAPLGVLVAVAAAALVVAVIGIPALLTTGGNGDVAGSPSSPVVPSARAFPANPEMPEDAQNLGTYEVPGYGEFSLAISGPTTEVVDGEAVELTCLYVVAPTDDPMLGGVTLCAEDLSPETLGIWIYGTCDDTNGSGTGVMSILGLDKDAPSTVRLTLDNGETVGVTTSDLAAVLAWDATRTVTSIEISGRSAEEIGSAIDLPFVACD